MKDFLTNQLNTEIIKYIQTFHTPILDKVFTAATITAEEYSIVLIMALLFWCLNKKLAYKVGFAYLPSNLINIGFKDLFHIKRIIGEAGIRSLRLETAHGYSFPSGHSQGASVLWTSFMIYFKKLWMYLLGIIIIFLVGFSRLYLGVHRPIDVIAGILLGIIITLLSNLIFNKMEYSGNYLFLLVYLIPMITTMFFYNNEDFYKMSGLMLSLCLGYILDDKYINFNEKSTVKDNIVKLITGMAVLLSIKIGVKVIFPNELIFHFLRYFLMGIWATAIAPFLFTRLPGYRSTSYLFVR